MYLGVVQVALLLQLLQELCQQLQEQILVALFVSQQLIAELQV